MKWLKMVQVAGQLASSIKLQMSFDAGTLAASSHERAVLGSVRQAARPAPDLTGPSGRRHRKAVQLCPSPCRSAGGVPAMSALVRLVLQFRLLVLAVAAGILAFGLTSLPSMSVDAFPEFAPPQVEIQTEALGLSAAEVEQLITSPMEADLLNGVAWVEAIRSKSVPGLSSIQMVFKPGTDLFRARQLVSERLTQARALPQRFGGASPDAAAVLDQPGHDDPADVKRHVGHRHVRPGPVDHEARAPGRSRRRERGDLGPARPATSSPGGSGAAPGQGRDAGRSHQDAPATPCGFRP